MNFCFARNMETVGDRSNARLFVSQGLSELFDVVTRNCPVEGDVSLMFQDFDATEFQKSRSRKSLPDKSFGLALNHPSRELIQHLGCVIGGLSVNEFEHVRRHLTFSHLESGISEFSFNGC